MSNPFLINIEDKDEYTFEEYVDIQNKLSQINIDNILNQYYPPKSIFYSLPDFKYRCTKSLKQKMVDVSSNKLPEKKLYKLGNGGDNKSCIICCTPFSHDLNEFEKFKNESETRLLASQQILKSLEEVNYNGHFYLLNGGFPNPTGIEMKYAGVPYCFKIFMMLEAKKRGFTKVIWIDSGCYCINNPQKLFDILDTQETIIKTVQSGNNYDAMSFQQTINLLNSITNTDLHTASYIETIAFGLNLESPLINKIIEEYYDLVKLGYPFLSIFPEEIVLTALFNKPEYKHLLYNQHESRHIQIHERFQSKGYYFEHRDYKKYTPNKFTPEKCTPERIFPLSFCIPDECVVDKIPKKEFLLASLIPGDVSTYTFKKDQEKEYYEMYQKSRFALTKMKGGWDCLRHYEILMNGCIPLFENLKDCPKYTMTTYPKELNDEAYLLYEKFKQNSQNEENIKSYDTLASKFLDHTRKNCTTSATAKYFLNNIKDGDKVKNILLITCHHGINYNRESLWIGLKRYIKSINGVAVEHEKLPFLYNDFDIMPTNKYYGNSFTLTRRLEKDDDYNMSESEIIEKINSNFWDLIIYGKVGPDEFCNFPYYDLVKTKYNKNQIAFIYGGDEIFNLKISDGDRNSYHVNMFGRHIYYYPYAEYVRKYKELGICFIRELDI